MGNIFGTPTPPLEPSVIESLLNVWDLEWTRVIFMVIFVAILINYLIMFSLYTSSQRGKQLVKSVIVSALFIVFILTFFVATAMGYLPFALPGLSALRLMNKKWVTISILILVVAIIVFLWNFQGMINETEECVGSCPDPAAVSTFKTTVDITKWAVTISLAIPTSYLIYRAFIAASGRR